MAGLVDSIRSFFTSDALNPHGICLLWRPELIWTHATSDVLIGSAYFSIPLALSVIVAKRPDVKFGWVVWLFVTFIMLCGITHWMSVWTLWRADYGIEAVLKAATALASVVTAVALWPLLPKVLAIPSQQALHARIAERDEALADLRRAMATMVEMREHETRQKLLLDELNHRVKNTLASVQSIASQTLSGAKGVADFRRTFEDRLMALSATHNLLVERAWESASMRDLVNSTLGHYGRPFVYFGPDLHLGANYAVTLGLALHELATNALKHGAWSGNGRVEVEVRAEAGEVHIVWRELDGPRVSSPRRRGFGSRLLEQGVAGELGGRVKIDYRPEGLVCTISAPASRQLASA